MIERKGGMTMSYPSVKWDSEKERFEIIIDEGDEAVIKVRQQVGTTQTWTEEIGTITAEGIWKRKRKPKVAVAKVMATEGRKK
ncbi:MAG: hypothetical protein A2Y82_02600 [Candidatus Buchananbacteria bacterium RBG_13_36_9]|uniref:Uncharacterized protein n=1 Tax=Candidatus Buchananbacteria bacterium RBG_13_36_9 TaxID=1797530 RepID=A0A1G1XNR3_9BACT|nr:MAG: hypothetical protein A2Y82_02600 [Candidatus Buchananbacteria bacterium RBG_13_36_9]